MFTLDLQRDIDAPPAVVWQVLTDFARYGEWNPFVPEARCDRRVGGAIEMQVMLTGKPQFQREWVSELAPGVMFGYRVKPVPMGTLRSHRIQRLTPLANGGTRYHSHFELGGWLGSAIARLMRKGLTRGFTGMADGLKVRAEAVHAAG